MNRLTHALRYSTKRRKERIDSGSPGYVYLIQCHQFIKIGYAADPKGRLIDLQMGCPYKLTVLRSLHVHNMKEVERQLHIHLARYAHAGEWFTIPDDVLKPLLSLSELQILTALLKFPEPYVSLQIPPYADDWSV